MAKIVTVYIRDPRKADCESRAWVPTDMSYIRWFRMSEALARCGHQVDIAVPDGTGDWSVPPDSTGLTGPGSLNTRELGSIDWNDYDVVKTLFNQGIETLDAYGGLDHPFIVSKLGSVVGDSDMPGIYFYGDTRSRMFAAQEKIAAASKYVVLLSEAAKTLWLQCHGPHHEPLLVPGAVDNRLPAKGEDPYARDGLRRCLFAGHIYTPHSQAEANATICDKLNRLGRLLRDKGVQLYMIGSGDVSGLDQNDVKFLGIAPYWESWNYLFHADVGIVVSAGKFMHNNESSKIYHYLRAGLPVVTESGFPNESLVLESKLGYVTPSEDIALMAEAVASAASKNWDSRQAVELVTSSHSWDFRAQIYNDLIARESNAFANSG